LNQLASLKYVHHDFIACYMHTPTRVLTHLPLARLSLAGSFSKDSNLRFALSAEEIGLIIHQLPLQQDVELIRYASYNNSNTSFSGAVSDDLPDKVLRIIPGEAGSVSYKVSFERGGLAVDTAYENGEQVAATGPLEVVAQLGEQVVMLELMRYSIPYLTGWSTFVDMSLNRSVDDSEIVGGGSGSGSGSGGGGYSPF
jgi:hypothetical protein